jgi:hypothetical protein
MGSTGFPGAQPWALVANPPERVPSEQIKGGAGVGVFGVPWADVVTNEPAMRVPKKRATMDLLTICFVILDIIFLLLDRYQWLERLRVIFPLPWVRNIIENVCQVMTEA